jgi:hypothetical protein
MARLGRRRSAPLVGLTAGAGVPGPLSIVAGTGGYGTPVPGAATATDYAGSARHERTLSQQRARAVCQELVADGVHVTTRNVGYGGTRPAVVGGSTAARTANRRVVVLVTG